MKKRAAIFAALIGAMTLSVAVAQTATAPLVPKAAVTAEQIRPAPVTARRPRGAGPAGPRHSCDAGGRPGPPAHYPGRRYLARRLPALCERQGRYTRCGRSRRQGRPDLDAARLGFW